MSNPSANGRPSKTRAIIVSFTIFFLLLLLLKSDDSTKVSLSLLLPLFLVFVGEDFCVVFRQRKLKETHKFVACGKASLSLSFKFQNPSTLE